MYASKILYIPLIGSMIRLPSKYFLCKVAPQYNKLVLPLGEITHKDMQKHVGNGLLGSLIHLLSQE